MNDRGLPLVGNQEQRKINASGIQNNEEMVNPSRQKLKQKREEKEHRRMDDRVSQNNEGMVNLRHQNVKQKISDHFMKSKNPSRIWYSGSGPGKDKESVIHDDNVTMENLYREDHQEHEVNSPQTNTITSAHHQENIASNSNGTTITRKESRALNANRKSRFNQRKLVFEIDDCAGRIVRDDSQTFITKGGCVV
nr:hypothetical protein [Tanacetum cinerariifolium]